MVAASRITLLLLMSSIPVLNSPEYFLFLVFNFWLVMVVELGLELGGVHLVPLHLQQIPQVPRQHLHLDGGGKCAKV